jgi:hypothetical protein
LKGPQKKDPSKEVLRAHFIFDPGAGVVKLFIHKVSKDEFYLLPTDEIKVVAMSEVNTFAYSVPTLLYSVPVFKH